MPIQTGADHSPHLIRGMVRHSPVSAWSEGRLVSSAYQRLEGSSEPQPTVDREPAALARLRAVDEALRNQREDRHRADALLALIANLVED
ncbi:hypothetical protein [Streptomyces sp. NPDC006510]|uniref:hypothetical protein n=1 Tax=Streptomyces sp. NPDC006510 TaxID=3155600 RepID=UPI0033B7E0C8